MSIHPHTAIVILAAGGSSRLGRPKQLVQHRGKALLQHAIDTAAALGIPTGVLVTGANAEQIAAEIDPRHFEVVKNGQWQQGIAASIRAGLARATANPQVEHVLFLLSDQPFVSVPLLQELLQVHAKDGKGITASTYKGQPGVPAIFSKKYFVEMQQLSGDQGAKKIMLKHTEDMSLVDFDMGHFDVDTPADIEMLKTFEEKIK